MNAGTYLDRKIVVHQDSITGRYWWIVIGRLNGLDTTYSEPRYETLNNARAAACRFIRRALTAR